MFKDFQTAKNRVVEFKKDNSRISKYIRTRANFKLITL
jgi:hypothetical protein